MCPCKLALAAHVALPTATDTGWAFTSGAGSKHLAKVTLETSADAPRADVDSRNWKLTTVVMVFQHYTCKHLTLPHT